MENDIRVACLSSVCDIQRICEENDVKLSEPSNRCLLRVTLKKLGPELSEKLAKKLADRKELQWRSRHYEVESILDDGQENGEKIYLVKWKGWSDKYNTWEPRKHLRCDSLLKSYHSQRSTRKQKRQHSDESASDQSKRQCIKQITDSILKIPELTPTKLLSHLSMNNKVRNIPGLFTRGREAATKKHLSVYKGEEKFQRLHNDIQMALKEWEKYLNSVNRDPAPIIVENKVDLEGPPAMFTYINDYQPMEGIYIPDDPFVGCECTDCVQERSSCCAANMGSKFAYNKKRRVCVPPGTPIYECNNRCKCGPKCINRVVQHGRKQPVCLFRTNNGRGWGVKALKKVKKGSFVMEYVGEVITNEEAERRGKIYDAEGRTYLFDLDYDERECIYTVDAGFYGNISHFVNHSCDPNLAVYVVWVNHLHPQLPRIALFAKRDIEAGEEFTFDYMMTGATSQMATNNDEEEEEEECSEEDVSDSREIVKTCPRSQINGDFKNRMHSSDTSSESGFQTDTSSSMLPTNMDHPSPYIHRNIRSSPPIKKYRIRCQCGAPNCRKYLC